MTPSQSKMNTSTWSSNCRSGSDSLGTWARSTDPWPLPPATFENVRLNDDDVDLVVAGEKDNADRARSDDRAIEANLMVVYVVTVGVVGFCCGRQCNQNAKQTGMDDARNKIGIDHARIWRARPP
jgi:hypothetical protein